MEYLFLKLIFIIESMQKIDIVSNMNVVFDDLDALNSNFIDNECISNIIIV